MEQADGQHEAMTDDDDETADQFIHVYGDSTIAKVFVQIHDVTGHRDSLTLVPREVADEIYRLATHGGE